MIKYVAFLAVGFSLCFPAFGQSSQFYAFFSPGQVRASSADLGFASEFAIHAGGGGKYIFHNGLGVGAEAGIAGPTKDWSFYNFGAFSANGYYVFKQGGKIEPFVTGGYTRVYGNDALDMNGGNFGGGITYWPAQRVGVLFEFRDNVGRTQGVTFQLVDARIGLVLRFK